MTYRAILGHDGTKAYFDAVIARGSLAHAYCFEGEWGIGKFTFARALAKALLCQGDAPLEVKFETGNHPDFLVIEPDGNSIKTEQIESLHSYIHMKPYLASFKIVILDMATTMTEQAQNKLLKLIEEPPGHALFILIADNAHKLLPTVKSRVIRMPFNPLTPSEMKALIFAMNLECDENLVDLSLGSMGQYLKWQQDQGFIEGVEKVMAVMTGLCENKSSKWLGAMGVFEVLKDDGVALLTLMRAWLLDLLAIKEGCSDAVLRLSFQRENMVQCSRYVKSSAVVLGIEAIDGGLAALGRQQNYVLVTESVLYRIQEAFHG